MMKRTWMIVAILSIGLNFGLATAIGLGVWQRYSKMRHMEFQNFQGEGKALGQRDPSGRFGQRGDGSRNAIQNPEFFLPLNCKNALDAGNVGLEVCPMLSGAFEQLPKDTNGNPDIPRLDDGRVDWLALGRHLGDGRRWGNRPPRPGSLRELEQSLSLDRRQRQQFRQILEAQRRERGKINRQLQDQRQALEALFTALPFDRDQALETYSQSLEIRTNGLQQQAERTIDFYDSLSDVQKGIMAGWNNGNILTLIE